ncbi:hypothetical protein FDO65_06340 [Nakamurella flava]|uniref:Uncharacterized protein n=1 Tax=Nakamurella flava TaxID=2576308 RepID=A0A4U6QM82_9ACTN|nr:hypothetical protein [Nakamurella flava]TKV61238.1 hypothetical protein FDO65_06340 [Nakamurella flava]
MVANVRRSRRWSRLLVRSGVIAGFGLGLWCAGAATAGASELPATGEVSSVVQEVSDAVPAPGVLSLPTADSEAGSNAGSASAPAEPVPAEPESADTGDHDSTVVADTWVSDTASDISADVTDLVPEQVVEPVVEISEPVVEDVVEPAAEPVSTITEPVVQDIVEPNVEPVVEDVVEPVVEDVSEAVEPVTAPVLETVTDEVVEPVTGTVGPIVSGVVEPIVDAVGGGLIDPVIDTVEPVVTPVPGTSPGLPGLPGFPGMLGSPALPSIPGLPLGAVVTPVVDLEAAAPASSDTTATAASAVELRLAPALVVAGAPISFDPEMVAAPTADLTASVTAGPAGGAFLAVVGAPFDTSTGADEPSTVTGPVAAAVAVVPAGAGDAPVALAAPLGGPPVPGCANGAAGGSSGSSGGTSAATLSAWATVPAQPTDAAVRSADLILPALPVRPDVSPD